MTAEEHVSAAIEELPVLDDERWRIPGAVAMLAISAPLLVANDAPRLRRVGSTKAVAALAALAVQLSRLIEILESLPAEANEALAHERQAAGFSHQFEFQDRAAGLLSSVVSAREFLAARPPTPPPSGRPAKKGAGEITNLALEVFESLTGTKATISVDPTGAGHRASGAYLRFLASVFSALDINASPEAQARAAIRRRMEKTPAR